MIAWKVGDLWHDPQEGVTFSGWITLPYPLPAGARLRAVAIPQPLRGPKEKLNLCLEMPLNEPPPEFWPDDLYFKGELMNQFFAPAQPSGRRAKVMFMGGPGTGKSLSALDFPKCAYIDNHGSVVNYAAAYPDNLYFPPKGQIATVDSTTNAIKALLQDPGDRLTVVIDDITTFNDQIDFKWNNLFLKRQPGSKGHHLEYYSNQPNDYIHPKREKAAFMRRLLALDLNVIIIARMKKEYAGAAGGADFMKVIGETFAGDPNLAYEFDYIFKLINEDEGRFAEIKMKQRVPVGGRPFPERFPFIISGEGKSNFFEIFQEYALPRYFENSAHAVDDPVTEEIPQDPGPKTETPAKDPTPGPQPAPPLNTPPSATSTQALETAAATSPKSMGTESGDPAITQAQLDELVELKQFYKIEKKEWDATLLKLYNTTTARALTKEQGEHFVSYLKTQRVPF